MNRNSKQFKEDTKRIESFFENTIKCKCGHSIVFSSRTERMICNWCGNYVYKNAKSEFKYKMKEQLIKNERRKK